MTADSFSSCTRCTGLMKTMYCPTQATRKWSGRKTPQRPQLRLEPWQTWHHRHASNSNFLRKPPSTCKKPVPAGIFYSLPFKPTAKPAVIKRSPATGIFSPMMTSLPGQLQPCLWPLEIRHANRNSLNGITPKTQQPSVGAGGISSKFTVAPPAHTDSQLALANGHSPKWTRLNWQKPRPSSKPQETSSPIGASKAPMAPVWTTPPNGL